jgi:membrane-associated phospholipid phosphatase
MRRTISLLQKNRLYFSCLLLLLVAGSLSLILLGKSATFISLNSYHPFWLNVFFINYTFMGDGIFALCLIALYIFYFKKREHGMAMLYAFLLSGAAVQLIKNLVSSPRPKLFFEHGQYLFFMDGVSLSNNSSFPSGHTATAFAIATVLILCARNRIWQAPLLLAAAIVGYSRIYLAQHFLIDVLIGALLGTLSGILAFYLFHNMKKIRTGFKKMHRFDRELASPGPGTIQPV